MTSGSFFDCLSTAFPFLPLHCWVLSTARPDVPADILDESSWSSYTKEIDCAIELNLDFRTILRFQDASGQVEV